MEILDDGLLDDGLLDDGLLDDGLLDDGLLDDGLLDDGLLDDGLLDDGLLDDGLLDDGLLDDGLLDDGLLDNGLLDEGLLDEGLLDDGLLDDGLLDDELGVDELLDELGFELDDELDTDELEELVSTQQHGMPVMNTFLPKSMFRKLPRNLLRSSSNKQDCQSDHCRRSFQAEHLEQHHLGRMRLGSQNAVRCMFALRDQSFQDRFGLRISLMGLPQSLPCPTLPLPST
jgi:hypothetical protein